MVKGIWQRILEEEKEVHDEKLSRRTVVKSQLDLLFVFLGSCVLFQFGFQHYLT